jgi:hypothetical protein
MAAKRAKKKKGAEKPPQTPPDESWKTADNIAQALDWYLANAAVETIARDLPCTVEQAQQLIEAGINKKSNETFQETARLQLARLNLAVGALQPRISAGDDAAINLMLRLEAQIVRVKIQMAPDYKRLFADRRLLGLIGLEKYTDKPNGRPPHEPTQWSCEVVERMAITGYAKEKIAAAIGIDRDTFNKYYGEIYETARPVLVTEAVTIFTDQALKKASKGDSADVRWLISRIGPDDFKEQPMQLRFDPEKVDAASNRPREIRVVGGLPYGSTPENPGGTPEPETIEGTAETISETISVETIETKTDQPE